MTDENRYIKPGREHDTLGNCHLPLYVPVPSFYPIQGQRPVLIICGFHASGASQGRDWGPGHVCTVGVFSEQMAWCLQVGIVGQAT